LLKNQPLVFASLNSQFQVVSCLEQSHLGGVFALEKFGSPVQAGHHGQTHHWQFAKDSHGIFVDNRCIKLLLALHVML